MKIKMKFIYIILLVIFLFGSIIYLREWTHFWDYKGNFEFESDKYMTLNINAYHSDQSNLVILKKYFDYNEISIIDTEDISYNIIGKSDKFYKFMKKHLW